MPTRKADLAAVIIRHLSGERLNATLVREDGREGDGFALIGPKRFDVPWKDLERQDRIAPATGVKERGPMSPHKRMEYALADRRSQFRIAAEEGGHGGEGQPGPPAENHGAPPSRGGFGTRPCRRRKGHLAGLLAQTFPESAALPETLTSLPGLTTQCRSRK
ncbi:MAG TPA: hypothetical protein DEQ28_08285 [Clostridiales bacterium]|nr:hypothetical protein [Clostridiales bacterium]